MKITANPIPNRRRNPVATLLTTLFICLVTLSHSPSSTATVIESVNETFPPKADTSYGVGGSEVGWMYTPSMDYLLTGVNTRFGEVVDTARIVTIDIFDAAPRFGGTLLASTLFNPVANVFSGGDFAMAIEFNAGEDYFVGFNDITGLHVNTTADPGATALETHAGDRTIIFGPGGLVISLPPDHSYDNRFYASNSGQDITRPILQFEGYTGVPEPATCALLGVGVASMGFFRLRKA